jgi:hypothetical protein
VHWRAITHTMTKRVFHQIWVSCVEHLLQTSQEASATAVHRKTRTEFSIQKGVRQHDPLSPYLLILVADGQESMWFISLLQNSTGRPTTSIMQMMHGSFWMDHPNKQHLWSKLSTRLNLSVAYISISVEAHLNEDLAIAKLATRDILLVSFTNTSHSLTYRWRNSILFWGKGGAIFQQIQSHI